MSGPDAASAVRELLTWRCFLLRPWHWLAGWRIHRRMVRADLDLARALETAYSQGKTVEQILEHIADTGQSLTLRHRQLLYDLEHKTRHA